MYRGFVKCKTDNCKGHRKVYDSSEGYEESCEECGYSGIVQCADIYVYLIRGNL